jgi:hypothetical protein
VPRLFWVVAHRSGTRSPVSSARVARKASIAASSRAVPLSVFDAVAVRELW